MGGDAAGKRGLVVEMTDAAQVAFALFADVGQKEQRGGQFDTGLDEGIGECELPGDAGAIVAGSGSLDAVAVYLGVEGSFGGEDGVEMRGENDDGAGAFRREVGCGEKPEDVSDCIDMNAGQAGFGNSGRPSMPSDACSPKGGAGMA